MQDVVEKAEVQEEATEENLIEPLAEAVEEGEAEAVLEAELAKMKTERRNWQEAQRELAENVASFEASEADLHFKLSCGQTKALFGLLDNLAEALTVGTVHEILTQIRACLGSIEHHDADFGKSLASNVYADVVGVGDHPHFDYWLNLLQGYLLPGESDQRVLTQIFTKLSGSPFESDF